jgi:hypothetical protein
MPVVLVGAAVPPTAVAPAAPPRPSFATRLEAVAPAARPPPGTPPSAPHPAAAALAHVDRAQARLDAVLAAARAGRTFTAGELIGLQAEAYRCAQTVDLASKLVEQGAQAVKQTLNTPL